MTPGAQPQPDHPTLWSRGPSKVARPVSDHLLLDNANAVFLIRAFSWIED